MLVMNIAAVVCFTTTKAKTHPKQLYGLSDESLMWYIACCMRAAIMNDKLPVNKGMDGEWYSA